MKTLACLLIVIVLFTKTPVVALGFLNPVNRLPQDKSFEVVDRLGTDTARIWCDAGRAAQSLTKRATDRIYVTRSYGPSITSPGIDGVSFTLAPTPEILEKAQALPGPRTLSLRAVGNNMSIGQSVGYCVFEIDG